MAKRNARKQTKGRKGSRRPTARDDIPMRPKHTYVTTSCVVPRVSDQTVVRALGHSTITSAAAAEVKQSVNFSLAQAGVNSGNWDQYKILAVRVTITPDQNAVGFFTNSTTLYEPLFCVIDYDDSTNLASSAAAEAYSNCIILGAGESLDRTFKPRMAISAYTGAFGGFANMPDLWIDSASTGVLHYGMKLVTGGVAAGQTQLPSWQINTEYFIAFRKSI